MGDRRLLTTHRAGQQLLALKSNSVCKLKFELKPMNSALLHLVLTCTASRTLMQELHQMQAWGKKLNSQRGAAPSTTHTNSSVPKEFDECCVDRSFQFETLPSWARSTTSLALLSNSHLKEVKVGVMTIISGLSHMSVAQQDHHDLSYWSGTLISKLISTSAPQNLLSSSCPWPS